jgi:ankyrin repeat protein
MLSSLTASGTALDRRLVEAAKRRDAQAVRDLVKQGVDVNVPQADGATPLHWVAHWDDLSTAELLLRAGANVNATEDGGVTPLALACGNRSVAMVERLLKAGADPNAGRETAVMTAARTGSAEVMKLLLAHGGDVNARETVRGQTALMWAASERHADVVRLLIEKGANVQARTVAPERSESPRAMAPVSNGANAFTPLLFAARSGDLASARILLEAGAKVNDAATDGLTALVLAALRGHVDVAMFLLDKGADANAAGAGYTALHWASGSWETELTVTSITPDREGEEWLTVAGVRAGRLDLIKALLTHGADPNARIRKTPARVGSSKNPGLPELEGATPFLLAAMSGATDTMRVLAAHGADVRLTTSRNGTPLMAAAGLGRVLGEVLVPESETLAAARLLIEMGAVDVNAADAIGNTALHYAAFMRRDSIVRLLAEHGARFDRKNTFGETPLWLSELVVQYAGGGRFEIVPSTTGALLRNLGAQPARPAYTLRPRYWPDIPHI